MEHIKNHLSIVPQSADGNRELTNSSKKCEIALLPEENEMVSLKYKGQRFGAMSETERLSAAEIITLKLSIITGWEVHSKELQDLFIEQLALKLGEGYANVNIHEIEYAFRNNTEVKDWGKAMNLSLIDEVMIPYLSKRRELSQIEEVKKPMLIERKEDMTAEAMESFLYENAKLVKGNKITVEFIPTLLYDWLEREGKLKLTVQEKWDYMTKAAAYRQGKLGERAATDPDARQSLEIFMQMKESGFMGTEKEILTSIAKKMCLYDYLLKTEG
jgi:hypothetical protein